MKVLSIGNSFSEDAQRYLHDLGKHNGVSIKAVNLFIGGCSLRMHYLNMLERRDAYGFFYNGEPLGLKVTIAEALASDTWDYVTLQQASHLSPKYETYTPYIEALADYVRTYCPHTKLMIHETWAYEEGSERLHKVGGFETADAMMAAIRDAYGRAAKAISADGIIPSGDAMLLASKTGIEKVHRDCSHAAYGIGRYLLSLTWYRVLTGRDITNDTFVPTEAGFTEEERRCAIAAVNKTVDSLAL